MEGSGDKEGLPEDEEHGPELANGGEGSRQGRVGIPSLPLLPFHTAVLSAQLLTRKTCDLYAATK